MDGGATADAGPELHDIKIAGKKTRARVDGTQFQCGDINNPTQREVTELPLNGIGPVDLTFDELAGAGSVSAKIRRRAALTFIGPPRRTSPSARDGNREPNEQARPQLQNSSAFELELNALVRKHFPHWRARSAWSAQCAAPAMRTSVRHPHPGHRRPRL